jgi:hypothetical protein
LRAVGLDVWLERFELSGAYVRGVADYEVKFGDVELGDEGVEEVAA